MALEDDDRAQSQLLYDSRRVGYRRSFLRVDRDLADRVFLLEAQGDETPVRERKGERQGRVDVDDGVRLRAVVSGQMQRRLARRLPVFFHRPAVAIHQHEVFGAEEAQRGVLAGNEKALLGRAAAQVSAPAADQPALEEKPSPTDQFALGRLHALPPFSSLNRDQGMASFSMG